jgi:hypothetical protein
MPTPTLLPIPRPKAAIRPAATAAIIVTRAIPDGTRKVSRKSEKISARSNRE